MPIEEINEAMATIQYRKKHKPNIEVCLRSCLRKEKS